MCIESQAEELAESFINGNRKDVAAALVADVRHGVAVALELGAMLGAEDRRVLALLVREYRNQRLYGIQEVRRGRT